MPVNIPAYEQLKKDLNDKHVTLVAVSKMQDVTDIENLHNKGQVDFGENYVAELVDKHEKLSPHIRWHFIGHLQTNKVKLIVPFVYLIHGVDSIKLLLEIDKQAAKHTRMVDCLLQVHIAEEETKFGLNETELYELLDVAKGLLHIRLRGLMGMGTNTDDENKLRTEFRNLKSLYTKLLHERAECNTFRILSLGMSGDYKIAIEEGSTMVRVGSLLFGARTVV